MSYDSLLIHTCTTQRFTEGAADSYGNPILTWANELVAEPCRLTTAKGQEIKVGAELVVADYRLFIGDVDITEQDRVIISTLTYEVLLVEGYSDDSTSHHKQVWLRIAR